MIECSLAEIKRHPSLASSKKKTKYGLYSKSIHHGVKGFGSKAWVVIVNIDLDYDKYASEGKSLEEITKKCIEYLNIPPKSKYGKRRKRKPLYGLFREEPRHISLKERDDKKYIQASLIVADRKRKCFWGEGEKLILRR